MKTALSRQIENEKHTYYSVPQVAELYGISQSTVRTMIRQKEIPYLMFRKRYVFRSDILERWENEQLFVTK